MRWRWCWRNTPTSTISRRSAISRLTQQGLILEANLTGAALLGMERSRLIHRRLQRFVTPASRPIFLTFLEKVFAGPANQVCEALLLKEGGGTFWAELSGHGRSRSRAGRGNGAGWRSGTSPPSSRRRRRNAAWRSWPPRTGSLNREIARRKTVEESLQKSEQHQSRLLEQSHHMQEQLRHLSHQILHAQEEERKRISRELHDDIAQTLVGINVHLAALTREAGDNPRDLQRKIARTQRLVEKSVDMVHQFARELRPAVLDDLGLIPALHSFMKEFTKRTGIHIHLTTFVPTGLNN